MTGKIPSKIQKPKGVILLFVVLLVSAIFSISSAIFSVTFGEILITGKAEDSFIALYSLDHALERALYRDFVQTPSSLSTCPSSCTENSQEIYIPPVYDPPGIPSGGCYTTTITRTAFSTDCSVISTNCTKTNVVGQYRCGIAPARLVKRAFEYTYPTPVAAFDYDLTNSGDINVTQGSTGSTIISRNLVSGTTEPINITVSGIPSGASLVSVTNETASPGNPCDPSCQSTITIDSGTALPGAYLITVTGDVLSGKETTFYLNVGAPSLPPTVAYYKFNEVSGTNATDSSGNGNTGTLVNYTGTSWIAGRFGNGLNFDGVNDFVTVLPSATVNNLGPMTVAAWIKADNPGENSNGTFLNKLNPFAGRWRFVIGSGLYKLNFFKDYDSSDLSKDSIDNAITPGLWTHVAVTWNGAGSPSGVIFYVNGQVVAGGSATAGSASRISDASSNLYIGNDNGTNRSFDGVMDEVRIYNEALDPLQVQALYNLIP